ncbi:MAG: hypothetical protein ACOYXT_25310 [Bacteroidota bacterium]
MAIYGAGSNWSGDEMKESFFEEGKFIIGWNDASANDLYEAVSLLKVGDILYLKANQPGSRTIRVKGVGVVEKSFIQSLIDEGLSHETISNWSNFYIRIKWVVRDEFFIEIPQDEGKLTNIRAATFYEENLPFVQTRILEKLFN